MYKIVSNKKLDWVKKLNSFQILFIPMIIFVVLLNFKVQYLLYILPLYIPIFIIGFIRQLKDTPGNIESNFMRNSMCFQLIFLFFVVLILFFNLFNSTSY